MMKTWLIRRAVRSPVLDDVTARISSSVCRLPFISISPLPSRTSSTPFAAAASLCGASTSSIFADIEAMFAGDVLDLGARADQSWNDDPELGGLDRAAQRGLVAGMHDNRLGRRNLLGPCDQAIVFGADGMLV